MLTLGRVLAAIAALLLFNSSFVFSQALPYVIYGGDDRHDLHREKNERLMELARSTAILVERRDVLVGNSSTYRLKTEPLGEKFDLCPGELFYDQPSVGFCSGFLAGEDILVSAGHCFMDRLSCRNTAIIFGFSYVKEDSNPTRVKPRDVFFCQEIIEQAYDGKDLDFAVVRLDRRVSDRPPLRVRTAGVVDLRDPLTVIGHPLGLPTKIAGNAVVRSVSARDYFVIAADTYSASSGSAVINSRTWEVEGIVVRGEDDFTASNRDDCFVSKVCAIDDCRGEDVIRSSVFHPWLHKPESTAGVTYGLSGFGWPRF